MNRPARCLSTAMATVSLAAAVVALPAPTLKKVAAHGQGGTVTMEWLSWSHYRFVSVNGKVVLTNPYTRNPDSSVTVESISQADLIVVSDGHADDMGQALEKDLTRPLAGGTLPPVRWKERTASQADSPWREE